MRILLHTGTSSALLKGRRRTWRLVRRCPATLWWLIQAKIARAVNRSPIAHIALADDRIVLERTFYGVGCRDEGSYIRRERGLIGWFTVPFATVPLQLRRYNSPASISRMFLQLLFRSPRLRAVTCVDLAVEALRMNEIEVPDGIITTNDLIKFLWESGYEYTIIGPIRPRRSSCPLRGT